MEIKNWTFLKLSKTFLFYHKHVLSTFKITYMWLQLEINDNENLAMIAFDWVYQTSIEFIQIKMLYNEFRKIKPIPSRWSQGCKNETVNLWRSETNMNKIMKTRFNNFFGKLNFIKKPSN